MRYKVVRTSTIQLEFDNTSFREIGAEVSLVPCQTEADIVAAAQDADAVIAALTRQPFSRKVLERLTKCRMVITPSIGYDYIDVKAATELGICVANVPDYCIEEVADHAMAMLLACARKLLPLNQAVRDGKWDSVMRPKIMEMWKNIPRLRGKTLGLIAFGNIARSLVPKAQAFGMKVISYDPYASAELAGGLGVELVDLDSLLRQSDFVSVHAPLNDSTSRMLGIEQFKQMKPTAYIINAARGAIINEADLCTALASGYIAGAGLDVTDPEPITPDSPLLRMDNVIITAHSAASSDESLAELRARPGVEVLKVLQGEWPRGLVNPKVKEAFATKWRKA